MTTAERLRELIAQPSNGHGHGNERLSDVLTACAKKIAEVLEQGCASPGCDGTSRVCTIGALDRALANAMEVKK